MPQDNGSQPEPTEMYAILLALQDRQKKLIENHTRIKERLDSKDNDVTNLRVKLVSSEKNAQSLEDI